MATANEYKPAETRQLPKRRKANTTVFFLVVVVVLAWCIAYGDSAFEMIDEPLEAFPGVEFIARTATSVGGQVGGAILALIVICLTGRYWKRAGLTILCAAAMQTGLTELIKHMAGRPRPDEYDHVTVFFGPGTDYHSFPSGHASYAFMLATIAAAYFPRWRWLSYGMALVIATSRVMLDRHFVSDVTVGGLLGFIAAYVFLLIWPAPHRTDADTVQAPS